MIRGALVFAAWPAACGLDDRTLLLAEESSGNGMAGSSFAAGEGGEGAGAREGRPGGQSGDGSAVSGSGGAAPAGELTPDLDGNGVVDRAETLIKNPSFDRDASFWGIEPFSGRAWSERDADARRGSGSVSIANIISRNSSRSADFVGSRQCIRVEGGADYTAFAKVYIGSGFGPTRALLGVRFHAADDCRGAGGADVSSEVNEIRGSWRLLHFTARAPLGSAAASIGLLVAKPADSGPVEALFDEILVRKL